MKTNEKLKNIKGEVKSLKDQKKKTNTKITNLSKTINKLNQTNTVHQKHEAKATEMMNEWRKKAMLRKQEITTLKQQTKESTNKLKQKIQILQMTTNEQAHPTTTSPPPTHDNPPPTPTTHQHQRTVNPPTPTYR